MKSTIKHIIHILPIIIAAILLYGAVTGKITKIISYTKNVTKDKSDDITEEETVSLPPGKINLIDNFRWTSKPMVDEYDPDNRQKFQVYGETVMEGEWNKKCEKELEKYRENIDLPKEKQGYVFNTDIVKNIGEEFELIKSKRKVTITNVTVNEVVDEKYLDKEKLLVDFDEFKGFLNEDGRFSGCNIRWFENNKKKNKENDVKLYWVVADINVKAESEWVDCGDIVPSLEYLYKDDDVMRLADKSYMMEGEWENQIGEDSGVVYVDLGLYDFSDINQRILGYPMRKGDQVTFQAAYVIPEEMLDYAYLWYECPDGGNEENVHVDDYYTNIYDVLVKVK